MNLLRTIFLSLIITALFACADKPESQPQKTTISIPIAIQALDTQQIAGHIMINGNRYDMTIQNNEAVVNDVPIEVGKSYDIQMVFEYLLPGNVVVNLVTFSETVLVDESRLVDLSSAYYNYTDDDNDQASNLDELIYNTNYNDAASMPITQLSLSPAPLNLAKGNSYTLTLSGSYSDGSAVTDFSQLSWNNTNDTVIGFDSASLVVSALSQGNAQLTASVHGVSSSIDVSVSSAVLDSITLDQTDLTVPIGKTASIAAKGNYSDGTTVDITSQVEWSVLNTNIANINNLGQITTVNQGATVINAQMGSIFSSANLTVGPPVVTGLTITPQSQTIALGETYNVTVSGLYSDGSIANVTTQVAWTTNSSNITVSSIGVVSATAAGSYTLTASLNGISQSATTVVTAPTLVSIALDQLHLNIPVGGTGKIVAVGSYSNGSTANITDQVTWSYSNSTIASIDNLGQISALKQGATVIYAQMSSFSTSANLVVSSGNPLDGIVANKLFYVSATLGSDSFDGLSATTAKKTINAAIALASAGNAVLVATGTYSVQSGTNHIKLVEGVSLYGGFSSNFTARAPRVTISLIQETLTTGGNYLDPNRAIEAGAGTTTATIVDGFMLQSGDSMNTGDTSTAIYVYGGGGLTISNNVIIGGAGVRTNGIAIYQASAKIHNNVVYSGTGTSWSFAIYNSNALSPEIYNNLIVGGGTGTFSYGIAESDSSSIIRNNTIDGGSGGYYSTGIYLTGLTGAAVIENNIIYNSGGNTRTCIQEGNDTAPGMLRNNLLYDCPQGYYVDNSTLGPICPFNSGFSCYTTIADVNNELITTHGAAGSADGNIFADPQFVNKNGNDNNSETVDDNNWHLLSTSPAVGAGLNGVSLSWNFDIDFDNYFRPSFGNAWAIGAYEP